VSGEILRSSPLRHDFLYRVPRHIGETEIAALETIRQPGVLTVSAFLRTRVVDAKPAKARRRVIKRDPFSGLLYDATDEGGPIVTHEQIKAALADFP